MSQPPKSRRETMRVNRISTEVSAAARALQSFESSLELPCWMTEGEGSVASSPFQLVLIKKGKPIARQLCLYNELAIGRSPGCGLILDDPGVSRLHARISGGSLVDEESANGTRVSGTPISRHELQDGDVIQAGSYELVFHRAEGALPDGLAAAPTLGGSGSDVGHVSLGDMTLRIGGDTKPKEVAVEVPRRGYLFMGGDTSKLLRKAVQKAVNRDDFVIGTMEGADLPLQGFRMPRVAAVIVRGLAGFTLVPFPRWPLKVELCGKDITTACPLEDGDKIGIGGLELTFRHGSS